MMISLIKFIAVIGVMLIMPFFMAGVIKKVKACFARRKGISVWQYAFDFWRLLNKGEVISNFYNLKWPPVFALSGILAAGMLIPQMFGVPLLNLGFLDFLLFAYFLSFSRFWTVVNAMESGCSFEGMGSSRELVFSVIGELAMFMTLVSLAFFCDAWSFVDIMSKLESAGMQGLIVSALFSVIFFVLMLLEGCRLPIDDPETHLELTMIHEAMVLDNSGVSLAFFSYGGMLKIYLFAALIVSVALSPLRSWDCYFLYFIFGVVLIAKIIGFAESVQPRLRMVLVHQYIFFAASLSLILMLITIIFKVE